VLDEAEMRGVVGAGYIGPSPTLPGREHFVEHEVRDRLNHLFEEPDRRQLDAHVRTVTGEPVSEILRYAQEQKIDLVVMGTHGRTGIAHLILGSIAEHVLRKSPCPVLTVHGPRRELAA
jgi:nucleotide-binding universal stress UspA family protein